jgi:hypothetical protein
VIVALFAALTALTLPATSAAATSIYTQVLHAYETHGSVPPCQFTSSQLQSALKGIDTYGAQYFADFTNAVQSALAARASGSCAPATTPSSPAAAPTPTPPLKLGPVTAATGASLPAPILLLALFGALLVLGGGIASLAWWRGWSPRWARSSARRWDEAGSRAQGVWADVEDWFRSG